LHSKNQRRIHIVKKELLLQRLDEICKSLERKGGALLLLGLGSVGIERDRLDEHSDLDFFVIVKPGQKERYVDHLDWLEEVHPLAYYFKNTSVGYKILFEDGIYGEYAVFEEWELENSCYSEGRVVWKDPLYTGIAKSSESIPNIRKDSLDHPLNEALTNLYVGLCRYARGEKLSATRFIQSYAVDSILSVVHLLEQEVDYFPDPFGNERRLERRYPRFAGIIGEMIQGYDHVPESALRILNYLEEVYPVNRRLSDEIQRLAKIYQ
jgi:lincosamide nucleotidyltransferase